MSGVVGDIVNQLQKKFDPDKIILFGSYARGDFSKDSDMDLLVIKNTNSSYHNRLIEARRCLHTTTPVDLFIFTQDEIERNLTNNPFLAEAVKQGIIVYEKQ